MNEYIWKMKQFLSIFIIAFTALSCTSEKSSREKELFTKEWRFTLMDTNQDVSSPDIQDDSWRRVDIPHDWSIEADFSVDYPSTPGGGALPGGETDGIVNISNYRKAMREKPFISTSMEFIGIVKYG